MVDCVGSSHQGWHQSVCSAVVLAAAVMPLAHTPLAASHTSRPLRPHTNRGWVSPAPTPSPKLCAVQCSCRHCHAPHKLPQPYTATAYTFSSPAFQVVYSAVFLAAALMPFGNLQPVVRAVQAHFPYPHPPPLPCPSNRAQRGVPGRCDHVPRHILTPPLHHHHPSTHGHSP